MSSLKEVEFNCPELERCILSGYRGSIAHGMYVPPKVSTSIDDKDLMYIVVPPINYYFGLDTFGSRGTKEIKQNEWDIVVYEAKKFITLLSQGNPNVLMMLWLSPQYYKTISQAGRVLINSRSSFVGRHVYKAFTGYAYSQLHKMTHNAFQGHMGEKRRQLVERFGFDTKNAAHLIRLLRMGIEFLKDGNLQVEREDASQLLEIKRGEWSLDRIIGEAERLFSVSEFAYLNSTLPERPNPEVISNLTTMVIRTALEEFGYSQ